MGRIGQWLCWFLRELTSIRESDHEDAEESKLYEGYSQAVKKMEEWNDQGDYALKMALELYANDEARRKSFRDRSSEVIRAGAIVSAITGASLSVLADQPLHGVPRWAVLLPLIGGSIFLVMAVIWGFQAQRVDQISTLGPSDLKPSRIAVAQQILNFTADNYRVTNRIWRRVDAAQRSMRNAIILIVIAIILVGVAVVQDDAKPASQRCQEKIDYSQVESEVDGSTVRNEATVPQRSNRLGLSFERPTVADVMRTTQ